MGRGDDFWLLRTVILSTRVTHIFVLHFVTLHLSSCYIKILKLSSSHLKFIFSNTIQKSDIGSKLWAGQGQNHSDTNQKSIRSHTHSTSLSYILTHTRGIGVHTTSRFDFYISKLRIVYKRHITRSYYIWPWPRLSQWCRDLDFGRNMASFTNSHDLQEYELQMTWTKFQYFNVTWW